MSLRLFVALALSLTVFTAYAESPKIGFVDAVRLIEEAPQGEKLREDLEKEFNPRKNEIRDLREELRTMESDLEKNSLVMKPADRDVLEQSILTMRRKLKRVQSEFQEDINLRRNEGLQKLQETVTQAIIDIAESEDYDLIVQQAVFASKAINITEKVLKKLGKK